MTENKQELNFKSFLEILRNDESHLTGEDALYELTYLLIFKLIEDNIIDPIQVSNLSNLKEDVVFNYMSIYERISVLSKQEWNKIFDLGEQTKLFNNLELSNLKSISKGVLNRERVKESGLKKADESLSKLKKFGIKY